MPVAARRFLPLAAGAGLGVVAYVAFALAPPMRALVGTTYIDAWVPAFYQAAAFPAFGAHLVGLGQLVRERARAPVVLARASLLGTLGALAVIRLLGAIPLSGHALFLGAALLFDLRGEGPEARDRRLLAGWGLLVTAYFKLFVWGDALWFALSLGVGAGLGRAARHVEGREGPARGRPPISGQLR